MVTFSSMSVTGRGLGLWSPVQAFSGGENTEASRKDRRDRPRTALCRRTEGRSFNVITGKRQSLATVILLMA